MTYIPETISKSYLQDLVRLLGFPTLDDIQEINMTPQSVEVVVIARDPEGRIIVDRDEVKQHRISIKVSDNR